MKCGNTYFSLSPKFAQSSFLVRTNLWGFSQNAVLLGPSWMGHKGYGPASDIPGERHVCLGTEEAYC